MSHTPRTWNVSRVISVGIAETGLLLLLAYLDNRALTGAVWVVLAVVLGVLALLYCRQNRHIDWGHCGPKIDPPSQAEPPASELDT